MAKRNCGRPASTGNERQREKKREEERRRKMLKLSISIIKNNRNAQTIDLD